MNADQALQLRLTVASWLAGKDKSIDDIDEVVNYILHGKKQAILPVSSFRIDSNAGIPTG